MMRKKQATYPFTLLWVPAVACALQTGCGPPFWPAIYDASWRSNQWNGGLHEKEYELRQSVYLVRELGKLPVLVPHTQASQYDAKRPLSPSRAIGGAWGVWGKVHLAHYVPHSDTPCAIPKTTETVAPPARLTITRITVEDLAYPPPIYYVQARIDSGRFAGMRVDVSQLIEDNVPPDSIWRKLPVVANDEYLQPVVSQEPEPTFAGLLQALKHHEWAVQHRAVELLSQIDADAALTVPTLLMVMQEPEDPEVRYEAIESLGRIGARAEEAVPTLVAAMKKEGVAEGYCRRAAEALARIGRPVSPVLLQALKDEHWRLRFVAAQGLASLGPEAQDALPDLLELLQSPWEKIGYSTPEYLGAVISCIASERGPEAVQRMLRGDNERARAQAAVRWVTMMPIPEEAIPVLIDMVKRGHLMKRVYAIEALGKFGEKGAPGVPAIIDALENRAEPGIVRSAAVRALGDIGPAAEAAIPALERVARTGDRNDRNAAAKALRQIRTQP